jgi:hypothetical protein
MAQPESQADDVTRHEDLLCAILTAGMLAAGHSSALEPGDVMRLYRRNRREMFPETAPPRVE